MTFEELKTECLSCHACGLRSTCKQVVFGYGNPQAEILFIGEAPGKSEDEEGRPFVGRSGKLLDIFLDAVGLSREKNIYITNICKCRPPENRDPLPEEWEACLPHLRNQFRVMQPKIVVCLGRIAAQRMIRPDFAVTKEHGQWTEKQGVFYTATFHPAALLRNPNNKPIAFEDFAAIREKAKEICEHTYEIDVK